MIAAYESRRRLLDSGNIGPATARLVNGVVKRDFDQRLVVLIHGSSIRASQKALYAATLRKMLHTNSAMSIYSEP